MGKGGKGEGAREVGSALETSGLQAFVRSVDKKQVIMS